MIKIRVLLDIRDTPLPQEVLFDHIDLSVKDSTGVTSTQSLTGRESPAWSGDFEIELGLVTAIAQAVDDQGRPLGLPVESSFTFTAEPPAPVGMYPRPTGLQFIRLP